MSDPLKPDGFQVVKAADVSDRSVEFLGRRLDAFMEQIRTSLDLHNATIVALGEQIATAISDMPIRVANVEDRMNRIEGRVARLEKPIKRRPRKKAKK